MDVPSNISNKDMRKVARAATHIPVKDQIGMFSFAAFLCLVSMALWQNVSAKSHQETHIKVSSAKLVLSEQDLVKLNKKRRASVVMEGAKQNKLNKSVRRAERTLDRLNAMVERRTKLNNVATEVHVYKSQGRLAAASAALAKAEYGDKKPVVQKPAKSTKGIGSFAAEVVKDVVRDEMTGFVHKVNLATKVGSYVVDRVSEE